MKKLFKILISLLIVAFVAYTAFWFYQKNNIQKFIAEVVEQSKENKAYISFSGYEIKGFPLKHDVVIKQPKLSFEFTNNELITSSLIEENEDTYPYNILKQTINVKDQITISLSTLQNSLQIFFPKETDLVNNLKDNSVKKYRLALGDSSRLLVNFNREFNLDNAIKGISKKNPKFMSELGSIRFLVNNAFLTDLLTKEEVYSINKWKMDIDIEKLGSDLIKLSLKNGYNIKTPSIFSFITNDFTGEKQNISSNGDIEIVLPQNFTTTAKISESKIKINELSFQNESYLTKLTADFAVSNSNMIPVGNANLKIENYKEMLDEMLYFLIKYSEEETNNNPNISTNQSSTYKHDLKNVSNIIEETLIKLSSDTNPKNIFIALKNDKTGNVTINNKPLQEVMAILMPAYSKIIEQIPLPK